jgi:addiction module RelB/DinJ family antitoxin
MSEAEKQQAALILDQIGLSTSAFLRMCMLRLIQEKGIPFSMKINDEEISKGLNALQKAGANAKKNGAAKMKLKDVNAEIASVRRKKK